MDLCLIAVFVVLAVQVDGAPVHVTQSGTKKFRIKISDNEEKKRTFNRFNGWRFRPREGEFIMESVSDWENTFGKCALSCHDHNLNLQLCLGNPPKCIAFNYCPANRNCFHSDDTEAFRQNLAKSIPRYILLTAGLTSGRNDGEVVALKDKKWTHYNAGQALV